MCAAWICIRSSGTCQAVVTPRVSKVSRVEVKLTYLLHLGQLPGSGHTGPRAGEHEGCMESRTDTHDGHIWAQGWWTRSTSGDGASGTADSLTDSPTHRLTDSPTHRLTDSLTH